MTGRDEVDFRDLLLRYAEEPDVLLISLTLLSGDKYCIVKRSDLVIGERVVSIIPTDGGESFFSVRGHL
jgi:hypothetical protein